MKIMSLGVVNQSIENVNWSWFLPWRFDRKVKQPVIESVKSDQNEDLCVKHTFDNAHENLVKSHSIFCQTVNTQKASAFIGKSILLWKLFRAPFWTWGMP